MKVSVNVLFQNWYLLGTEYISSHALKTEPWYLLGSEEHSCPLYMGVPLRALTVILG